MHFNPFTHCPPLSTMIVNSAQPQNHGSLEQKNANKWDPVSSSERRGLIVL